MYPKALVWPADIIGGLLLGAGISIAGACPGTVLAQIGSIRGRTYPEFGVQRVLCWVSLKLRLESNVKEK